MKISCRQCGSNRITNLGAITQADTFAGLKLSPAWNGGSLYSCNECHLAFRFPIRTSDEYLSLYNASSESTYYNASLRNDQVLVRDSILRKFQAGAAVLDIGCFNGALLNSLGQGFSRFGIEASEAACVLCRDSGINIIAKSAAQLDAVHMKFDVICLVDVVEHIVNPRELIKVAMSKLNDDGQLIISTGNSSSFAWKCFGGRYWYCSFPEHISFISPEWIANIALVDYLSVVELKYFPHINPAIGSFEGWVRFIGRFINACAEVVYKKLLTGRVSSPKCKLGFPGVVNDHMLVTLKRNP